LGADPNMATALQWANFVSSTSVLPESLRGTGRVARVVDAINGPLAKTEGDVPLCVLPPEEVTRRLQAIERITKDFMPDVPDGKERVGIALRLWSGCLMAAKTIAEGTRSGQNTPEMRTAIFARVIDPRARIDPVFLTGVEAAPAFKRLQHQEYSVEGVPRDSPVMKDA